MAITILPPPMDREIEVLETDKYTFTLTSIKEKQYPNPESGELETRIVFTFGKILDNGKSAYVSYKTSQKTGKGSKLKEFAPKLEPKLAEPKYWTKDNIAEVGKMLEGCVGNMYSLMIEKKQSANNPGVYYNTLLTVGACLGRDLDFETRMEAKILRDQAKLAIPQPSNPANQPRTSHQAPIVPKTTMDITKL